MQCLSDVVASICGGPGDKLLVFVQCAETAGAEAASKLTSNREQVAQDITNSGPTGLKGGKLTQLNLKRLDPKNKASVDKMLVAVCDRLLGKMISAPSTPDEALVWAKAARFLSNRIQVEPHLCPGRTPDMSAAQASAMRKVLGQIEAASKLMSNLETVVKDITNTGPRGVYGRALSQKELKRVDPKYAASVKQMACEVYGRLYGTVASEPPATSDVQVWMDAAAFLSARIQGPEDWVENEYSEHNRESDMSNIAKTALRTMLGQMEAALKLMSNREKVAKDITNSGPSGVNGGNLTQLSLSRVEPKNQASVDKMLTAVCDRLLGKGVSAPSTPEEASTWAQAAAFFPHRIQVSSGQCPGRAPDMSCNAGREMLKVLVEIEAASKLMSNREKVVQDITNPGPSGVNGGKLTQLDLKRVDQKQQTSVDAMVKEVCSRLLGNKSSAPSTEQKQVWAEAAQFLNGRIQESAGACPGRTPDMSAAAAKAMRTVLTQITS